MKIEYRNQPVLVPFKEVKAGQTFTFQGIDTGALYIRITGSGNYNAVKLESGEVAYLADVAEVLLCNGKVIVE